MMYNFDDEVKSSAVVAKTCEPAQVTLGATLEDACGRAIEALNMVRVINKLMFANCDDTEGKRAEPRCFRDTLVNHNICLSELCRELKHIMDQLGV